MLDLITIGDALIDTHVFIDNATLECDINQQNCQLCLNYATKIPIAHSFQKVKELMIKKNHDYGEAWRAMAQMNIISEIKVKIRRTKNSFEKTQNPLLENVYDIMNYCAFALILIEEKVHEDL
jgi:hypothetical protein